MVKKGFITTAIGVMSGTSLDGLDLCYVRFKYEHGWSFQILATKCVDYDLKWNNNLSKAHQLSDSELENLDVNFGNFIAQEINLFIHEAQLENPNWVCSHGHTVFHSPSNGYTRQIGCGKTIANQTKTPTVSDFRTLDVQLGGEGAPLVPIGDKLLFEEHTCCLNLGGFANISFDENGVRKAFDICPVNIVFNQLAKELSLPFDRGGKIARNGTVDRREVHNLIGALPSSKHSLSREWLEEKFLPKLNELPHLPQDKLAIATAVSVTEIATVINERFADGTVLCSGGGTRNTFLMEELKKACNLEIVIPEDDIIDFKEALIFALLGILKSKNQINVLKSVTHASQDSSSGTIHYPRT